MAKCEYCGKRFSPEAAKQQFRNYFYLLGEMREYDDFISHELCAECAINDVNEGMGAWDSMSEYYTVDD